jgi:hypothetical protein
VGELGEPGDRVHVGEPVVARLREACPERLRVGAVDGPVAVGVPHVPAVTAQVRAALEDEGAVDGLLEVVGQVPQSSRIERG